MNVATMAETRSIGMPLFAERTLRRLVVALLATGTMITSGHVSAWELELSKLSNGYSDCTYQDNGNGTSTVGVTFDYKSVDGHIGRAYPSGTFGFFSRAVLIYTYDQNGRLLPSGKYARTVSMNGAPSDHTYADRSYTMYTGTIRTGGAWRQAGPQIVRVAVILDNRQLSSWPAIGVRAGNYTAQNDVAEISGLAYIGTDSSTGNCNVITKPEIPPPPVSAKITMTAPDWNLGELAPGTRTKWPIASDAEQLCFTYDNLKWTGLRYAINATNQNGLSGAGSYQLKHLTSPSDAVPYRVVLQDAMTNIEVELPNTRNVVSTLGNSGRDCFNPRFTADTPKAAKEGDYGDVLTFTIVARP